MTTSRRALLLAAAGVSATAPGCVGRTTPAASATGTPTDPLPDATCAYTHQQPGGNRVLAGGGDIVGATPVEIPVGGTPTWLLAFARGGETYWTVVADEGLELRATRPGYATHTYGSRNLDQALAANIDDDGRMELLVPTTGRVWRPSAGSPGARRWWGPYCWRRRSPRTSSVSGSTAGSRSAPEPPTGFGSGRGKPRRFLGVCAGVAPPTSRTGS